MSIEELEAELEVANRDANWLTEAAMEATVETAKLRAELETVKRERDEARAELDELWKRYRKLDENNDNLIEAYDHAMSGWSCR